MIAVIIKHCRGAEVLYGACNGSDGFWTAGQREDPTQETSFVWKVMTSNSVDKEMSLNYTNWYDGEPNNLFPMESCLVPRPVFAYEWNDGSCTDQRCYVCELDL